MTPFITESSHLVNPLASSLQLETSASRLDGVPRDLEDSICFETGRLLQAAGVSLRLPQEITAQSIVLWQRFSIGPDGGSFLEYDAEVSDASIMGEWKYPDHLTASQATAAAALYLAAKSTGHSQSPRNVITVFSCLAGIRPEYPDRMTNEGHSVANFHIAEADYELARERLYRMESIILRTLGFNTHVAVPFTLCINYMQTLDTFKSHTKGSLAAKRAFAHLNSALLSPQLLCLTHQPSSLATASIYLAARETDVKLPEVEWWEVFDVDREELGFLVVALKSLEGFAMEEKRRWGRKKVPLTVLDLESELERRKMLDVGE